MQFVNEQALDVAISGGDGASPASGIEAAPVKADAALESDMSNQAHDAPIIDWAKVSRMEEVGVYFTQGKK